MIIYLNEPIDDEAYSMLNERAKVVSNFNHPEEIEGIITLYFKVGKEVMEKCPNLKVVGKHGVGTDNIDKEEAKKRNIAVVNTPTANSRSVAEFIAGLILDISKNITLSHNKSIKGEFKTTSPTEITGIELAGKTLGLIGTGNIARHLAHILKDGFDMEIIAYNPHVDSQKLEEELGFKAYDDLNQFLSEADVVNISVPLTEETKNLISTAELEHFKEGAILINAARGGVVDEEALYTALKEGKLRGAACDTFVNEPPTGENTKLFELENFVGTPHIASITEEAQKRMATEIVEEVLSVAGGNEPKYLVK